MNALAMAIARNRRDAAAFHLRCAEAHGAGSKAYAYHMRGHVEYVAAAERAEAGDTRVFTWPAI